MHKKPKKWIPAVIACTLILVICVVSGLGYIRERYSPSQERADLKEMYRITAADDVAVMVDDLMIETRAVLREGEAYLPYAYVQESLNKRVYVDEREHLLLYALPDQVVEIPEDMTLSQWDPAMDQQGKVWFTDEENAVIYISVSFLGCYTDLDFTVYTEPGRLYIDMPAGILQMAVVEEDSQIRKLGGIKSPIVADVAAGTGVVILDAMEEWSQVRTEDGWIGYIQNKQLTDYSAYEKESDFVEPVYTNISKEYEICLVWHQVFSQSGNEDLEDMLSDAAGVNTISPTWFSLSDNEGNFTSLASTDYVDKAHAMGLEVWGLVDNFSPDMSTYELLSRTSTRRNLIQNLLDAALEYDLDGINIDFEGMKSETGPHFVQFIRELSIVCRQYGLVLSIDNYVPSGGTKYYDRAEQAAVADYVIVMGYDEHWSTSDAGSTASLPFVRKGIEDTLLEVPQDKLINALPFYTRVWEFDADAEIADGADPLDVEYVVSSTAVGMSKAMRLLTDHEAELVWDDETGQYYGEYEEEGSLYRIWLEDAESLRAKLNATAEYDLAGIAFWKLGLESDEAWEEVEAYMDR